MSFLLFPLIYEQNNTLKNDSSLPYTKEVVEKAIADCGFSPTIRGEALTLEEFAKLANYLYEC